MPRAVLDTSVLISAMISPVGAPAGLLRLAAEGAFDLVVSPRLLNELLGVLRRPKFRRYAEPVEARSFVVRLRHAGLLIEDPSFEPGLTPDPKDDFLVALARAAGSDVLVSGDRHLTELEDPRPPVLTPREFLDRLAHAAR